MRALGKVNPLCPQELGKRQLDPVKDRLNELDQLPGKETRLTSGTSTSGRRTVFTLRSPTADQATRWPPGQQAAMQAQQTAQQANARAQLGEQFSEFSISIARQQTPTSASADQTVAERKAKDALDQW